MAQVTLGPTLQAEGASNQTDIPSVVVAAGEGIVVTVTLETTDTSKEVLSVRFDPTGDDDTFPIAEREAFSPTHSKLRGEIWVLGSDEVTKAQTATVRVTLAGGNAQTVWVTATPVANAMAVAADMLTNLTTAEGVGSDSALSVVVPNKAADDLAFGHGSHFTSKGAISPYTGSTDVASNANVQGVYKGQVSSDDGAGTIGWSAGGGNKESMMMGVVIVSADGAETPVPPFPEPLPPPPPPVGTPPVGSIIAWHKNLNVPTPSGSSNPPPEPQITLPGEWIECDGKLISDPESPFDGLKAPQLNSSVFSSETEGLFLRGSNVSGWAQVDTMKAHTHQDTGHTHAKSADSDRREFVLHERPGGSRFADGGSLNSDPVGANTATGHSQIGEAWHLDGSQPIYPAQETSPVHMGVVWIMRIK